MTAEEDTAYHRGKLAAFADSRPHKPGETRRCEFKKPHLRAAWRAGYDAQVAALAPKRTAEDDARAANLSAAITDWLARNP